MKPISSRVQFLYKEYYYNKAKMRHDFFCRYTEKFLEKIPFEDKLFYSVDTIKMSALIDSYFLDVIRFKEYHFNTPLSEESDPFSQAQTASIHCVKLISLSKVAAYTAKWLLKYSPIFIQPRQNVQISSEEQNIVCAAPAILALNLSLHSMGVDIEALDKAIYKNLIYHFRFRNFDERAAFLYFDLIMREYADQDQLASSGGKAFFADLADDNRAITYDSSKFVASDGKAVSRRHDSKSYSVFIASPGDCERLRTVTQDVLQEINLSISKVKTKLVPFAWECDKIAEYTLDYQESIFKEARKIWEKDNCDIMILMLWYRFGPNTVKEYEYYIEQATANGSKAPATRFMCCCYDKAINPSSQENANTGDLQKWVKSKNANWAEISPKRNSIKTTRQYATALRMQLEKFLNEPSE